MVLHPKVEVYTSKDCSYCEKAKTLLEKANVEFVTLDLSDNKALHQELVQRLPGARTLPQIFIDGISIGSYEDLLALLENRSLVVPDAASEPT